MVGTSYCSVSELLKIEWVTCGMGAFIQNGNVEVDLLNCEQSGRYILMNLSLIPFRLIASEIFFYSMIR